MAVSSLKQRALYRSAPFGQIVNVNNIIESPAVRLA